MDGSDALTFRASLEPNLYRDIALANTASLHDLAEEINRAYGFDFDHCFGFYDNLKGNILRSRTCYELFVDIGEDDGNGARSVVQTMVDEAFPEVGSKLRFLFDYGDEWIFLVELVDRKPADVGVRLPSLVASEGEAPPQYDLSEDEDW